MDTWTLGGLPEDAAADGMTGRASGGQLHTRLVVLADAETPTLPSSYHALDDLSEVRFRRGARRVERAGGVLTLWFPDPWISSEHGCLIRGGGGWMLDDRFSKNGSIVDGVLLRGLALHDGAVIELGHTFLLFRRSRVPGVPDHLRGDLDAAQLPALPAGMSTFSPRLARDLEALARIAASPVSLVLCGETGTGKEVIARAVHELSRRAGAFVAVNCGALPATLESELFGHRRGAFTGAVADRKGLVRSADQGTLFLDEIGELPLASQPALLRVLQEREVLPVGADRPTAVDLRVICATLRDLEAAVGDGRFRADLHARIRGHVLTMPPLRERREDLGLLIATLMPPTPGGGPVRLTVPALRALMRYDWPHNIRELEHVLASAVALARDATIDLEHMPERVLARSPLPSPPPADALEDVQTTETTEPELGARDRELRDELVRQLEAHDGNVLKVAHALGKRRAQIYRWVDRLTIDLSKFRRP